jgi:hypothetical protein
MLLMSTFGGATVNPFHLMRRDLINLMSNHHPQQSIYTRCGIVATSATPFGQPLLLSTGIFRHQEAATCAQPLPSKLIHGPQSVMFQDAVVGTTHLPPPHKEFLVEP